MRGLATPTLIILVGAFFCATGVLFSLWLACSSGLYPLLVISVSVAIGGMLIMVMGGRLQGIELFIQDILKGKGPD